MSVPGAFGDSSEKLIGSEHIYLHPSDPSLLVREFAHHFGQDSAAALDYASEAKQLHDELSSSYDIPVAPYVIDSAQRPGYYSVTVAKIDGQSFEDDEVAAQTSAQRAEAIHLVDRLGAYLGKKIVRGEVYLTDLFGFSQYMYTSQNEAVLVDIEPMLGGGKTGRPAGNFHYHATSSHQWMDMAFLLANTAPEHRARWEAHGRLLLKKTCEVSGLVVPDSIVDDALRAAANTSSDNGQLSDHFQDLVTDLPENEDLMTERRRYLNSLRVLRDGSRHAPRPSLS